MDGVFIVVVIVWYDMLMTIWCTVPFQNFVVIPDVLQVSQFWFQLREYGLIIFFLLLQLIVFRRQLFQRRHISIMRGINRLGVPVTFNLLSMVLIEF